MTMTAEEIRRDYRLAKNPKAQIGILADINGVEHEVIQHILDGKSVDEAQVMHTVAPNKPYKYYLNLGKALECRSDGRWTDEEKQILREMWNSGYRGKEIAIVLGRTECAIANAVAYQKLVPRRRKIKSRK